MSNDTYLTLIGNLVADPEVRFTASGAPVATFTVASTPRTFDRQSNEFKDGETLFQRCSVWRDQAENVAESLRKGHGVIVYGKLKSRSYETKAGERRTATEVDVEHVGPSLRNARAVVTKAGQQPTGAPQGASAAQGAAGGGFGAQNAAQGGWGTNGQTGFVGFESPGDAPF